MDNTRPLITVIVPIYKVEKYLDQCLDTICGQTYSDLQIILVDDGSPDDCGKICDDRAAVDARIQVIHKSNGGLSDARNAGMELATGRFLFFVDSDDYLDRRTIELLLKDAEQTGADIVMAGTRPFLDGQQCAPAPLCGESVLLDRSEAMRRFARDGWGAWGKLYRREIHDGILFPYGKIHEDEALCGQLPVRPKQISRIDSGCCQAIPQQSHVFSFRNCSFVRRLFRGDLPYAERTADIQKNVPEDPFPLPSGRDPYGSPTPPSLSAIQMDVTPEA